MRMREALANMTKVQSTNQVDRHVAELLQLGLEFYRQPIQPFVSLKSLFIRSFELGVLSWELGVINALFKPMPNKYPIPHSHLPF
jgi:hypothetical protein